MFKLVRKFSQGAANEMARSVLCTDGKFHAESSVNARRYNLKTYKTEAGANRGAASWNTAIDFCKVEAA